MALDDKFWRNKTVVVSGHTGFKGTYLCLMLANLGANVYGIAKKPDTKSSLYELISLDSKVKSIILDLCDKATLQNYLKSINPEIIFHLAAQAIVGVGYDNPYETFASNTLGTLNLFEVTKHIKSLKLIINVTTDKVYEKQSGNYKEQDPIFGYCPYSGSKACSEIISQTYYNAYLQSRGINLLNLRAGNVFGGGDFHFSRLLPYAIDAIIRNKEIKIKHPDAIRQWQHVLDVSSAYINLAQIHYQDDGKFHAYNIAKNQSLSVVELCNKLLQHANSKKVIKTVNNKFFELDNLTLDSSKLLSVMTYDNLLSIDESIALTWDWYLAYYNNQNIIDITYKQLQLYKERLCNYESIATFAKAN